MKAKLIILGCGNSSGVPRIDGNFGKCKKNNKKNLRTRCSAIIIKGRNAILIDSSPDIRMQFLSNKITSLSSIIYTHEHADQTNGLFELRPFFWKLNKKIDVYGDSRTIKSLKNRFDYCFKKNNSAYPAIVKANIVKSKFSLGKSQDKINFKTTQVKHGIVKSTAYIFEKTAYISDCNDLSVVSKNIFQNLNYLIIDCLKIKKNFAHFNLEQCLYIHNCLKPKKTILTNLHSDLDYETLLNQLPKNIIPAFDGLKLDL